MLVYVDDLFLTCNNPTFLGSFVTSLSNKFSLKDLGDFNYFMGVEGIPIASGIFLSQQKYILDLLEKTNMSDARYLWLPFFLFFY